MDVSIPTTEGPIEGYLALPNPAVSGPGPWPGVVIIHDIVGITQDDKVIAERFATAGYVALLPDLYSRGGVFRCVRASFAALQSGRGQAIDDIDATRAFIADRPDSTGKVGIVGFCQGGGFALLMAARGFDASAPYYGLLPRDDSALDGACPIVASFGGRDRVPGMKKTREQLGPMLTERGVPHDIKIYPKAAHSFANRYSGQPILRIAGYGYHHDASEDAWRRVLSFFATHLA